jgi:glycine betaine/proline transport system substrate-binding protein
LIFDQNKFTKNRNRNLLLITGLLLFTLISFSLTACTGENTNSNKSEKIKNDKAKTVNIVYVAWDSEIASSYVLKAVIENKLGYECEMLEVTLTSLWDSIAHKDQDVTVAAWLPSLQKKQRNKYKDKVINLGPNLEGTKIGLVVPDYVSINSINQLDEYADKFDGKIIGIEPDAGIMKKTEKAISKYNLNDYFDLVTGSDPTMTTILSKAIKNKKWIVVTGWTPHWKFAKWNLKYLKDPKNVYGKEEHISTIVRKGLKKDMPDVYKFLDNFYWESEDMEECMLLIEKDDLSREQAAEKWIRNNQKLVNKWLSNIKSN